MRCDECRYEYDALARAEIAPAMRSAAAAYRERLAHTSEERLRAHTAPGVWTPLEYACHVRDILRVQRQRIQLALDEEVPSFAPMGREELAVNDRYNEQAPKTIGFDLAVAADALATMLDLLTENKWQREGLYNWPTQLSRTIEWIGRHTVHELRHHLMDIDRQLA